MTSKLIPIILLILLVPVVQAQGAFEDDPNPDNYGDLGNPTLEDFGMLDSEEQHQVYSDEKNIGRCSECDDAYFGGESSKSNIQRNPEAAESYISNLAGMDVEISKSLGQIAVVNGEVVNPPGSSLIKNLMDVSAVANKEGGFTYTTKSEKTINVVGNEGTIIEFKDNLVVTSSGAKIDLSDITSIKIDAEENVIISINQNEVEFGKDVKFELAGNKLSIDKNVMGHIKKGDDWANFRTFDRTEAVFGTNGNYALKGNFFYSGKNEIGVITVPTVLEGSLREQEIEKGLDIIDRERKAISLCVGNCDEFKAFLGSNQVLISDNQVRVRGFSSVDIFGKGDELFSLIGQHKEADFVIERDTDDKLLITQKNIPPRTEKEFEAEVKIVHEKRINDLTKRREKLQEATRKETNVQAKTKLENQIKEVERLIDRENDKYGVGFFTSGGRESKSIDYGFVSYSKGNTLIAGSIGPRQYVGAFYDERDFYPITTELNQLSYQHGDLGAEEKYFTIITQSNDPNLNTETVAYEGYTIMDVTGGEMKSTDTMGNIIIKRSSNLKGEIDYYTLTKTSTTEEEDGTIKGNIIFNPIGVIKRKTTMDSKGLKELNVGEITITPSETTASLDLTKFPSTIVGNELKEEAAQTMRDIFSEASLKHPDYISKSFESLGLGKELVDSLKQQAPEIIDVVITDSNLDDGIYEMDFKIEKIDSNSAKVTIDFKDENGNKATYTTTLRGFNYDENYNTVRDKLTSGDIAKQAISELNKQKERLLKFP